MERAAASLGAPGQPGWHALTNGFEKAVDIYTGTCSLLATFKKDFLYTVDLTEDCMNDAFV